MTPTPRFRAADESVAERNARRPGAILIPAAICLVSLWVEALAVRRPLAIEAAAGVTLVMCLSLAIGVYIGGRDERRRARRMSRATR